MTDAELIRRFRDGESHAFNGLVGQWQSRLYNFILRQVGDREEAHDLSQKVLIKAHRNLRRLRDPEKFSTWIYQIAVNTCRDELRRRKRRPTISLDRLETGVDQRPDGWREHRRKQIPEFKSANFAICSTGRCSAFRMNNGQSSS